MNKKILIASIASLALVLGGCATNEGPTYDGGNYAQIKKYDVGTVLEDRPVVISDDGSGAFLGAIMGAVIGSTIGGGDGSTLASLAGGVGGYYAGKEIGKANGDELTVKLTNGQNIVIVVKGQHINVGDKIKIIRDGNKVAQVEKIK